MKSRLTIVGWVLLIAVVFLVADVASAKCGRRSGGDSDDGPSRSGGMAMMSSASMNNSLAMQNAYMAQRMAAMNAYYARQQQISLMRQAQVMAQLRAAQAQAAQQQPLEEVETGTSGKSAASQFRMPTKEELLTQFDANNNGRIDNAEREAVRTAVVERRKELRVAILTEFDANENGRIDGAERAALNAVVRAD